MSKRIFISTNFDRLRNVLGEAKRNQKGINLLSNNNFLYWNTDSKQFQATATQTNLFLVKDEVRDGNNAIDALGGIEIQDTDYLMRHSKYTHRIQDFGNRIHQDGEHEQGNVFYTTVFNFIFDNGENKAQRIIEFLFPSAEAILSKKLDLLRSLLVPPVDYDAANKRWEEIKKAVKIASQSGLNITLATNEDALTIFQSQTSSVKSAFDPNYHLALTTLRNSLLPN